MIEVTNLAKRYGRFTAVRDLSFRVGRGEILGFLGPNGAGKTTTMRILSCYMPATSGRITVGGLDIAHDSLEIRRRVGYLPENVPLYQEMRVIEYLRFRASLKGLRGRRRRERVEDVMSQCGLEEVAGRIIGQLSKGYRQRVGLAESLVNEPDILILDEPTIGLDPIQIRQIRGLIKGLAGRHTIILSTHILSEVEMICRRVLMINRGRIVADDSPENLVSLMKGNKRFILEARGPRDEIMEHLVKVPGVVRVHAEGGDEWATFVLDSAKDHDIREDVFRAVVARGWSLRELRCDKQNLEDAFVAMTYGETDA